MKVNKKTCLMALLLALAPSVLTAKVVLPSVFTDNMVLQQQSQTKIWGTATAWKKVTITTSWDKKTYEAIADSKGAWSTTLSTPKAGGPYSITLSDGEALTLQNVLIGEVWICSGQSNMEMNVKSVRNSAQEISDADNFPQIRLLHVENSTSPTPLANAAIRHGGWEVCSSTSIGDFSASAYFFGKSLQADLNVPIGLIETCWGGTLAEAWTGAKTLNQIPYFQNAVSQLSKIPQSKEGRNALYEKQVEEWKKDVEKIDVGFQAGQGTVKVPGYLQENEYKDFKGGVFWMRKTLQIPASWAGKDLTLRLGNIDDNDFTYFNDTEIGHTEGYFRDRTYTIPGKLVRGGKSTLSIRVMDTGGLGGFGGDAQRIVLECSQTEKIALSGQWEFSISIPFDKMPPMPVNTANDANYPSFLYNAMLYPLKDFAIKGAIWYQGEANVNRAAQYAELLPMMITNWREIWGYSFPFYIVQLANYMDRQTQPEESEWAQLRDAQKHSLHLENTGMAVIIDIGEAKDIHPKNKQEVGRRLALAALAQTYGKDVVYSGPVYNDFTIEGNRIRLHFTHTHKGLNTSDGGPLQGFTVAGPDHVFHWAEAVFEGDQIVVSCKEVAYPVAVRYAWANNPLGNLYNGEGLPAGPFRTDNW